MLLMVIIDEARRQAEESALRRQLQVIRASGVELVEVHAAHETRDEPVSGFVDEEPRQLQMRPGWFQRRRIRDQFLRDLGRDLPTVIISFGQEAALTAADLSSILDCPLLVECWEDTHLRTPPVKPARVAGYFTAVDALGEAMRVRGLHDLVATVPYPVDLPPLREGVACDPSMTVLDAAPLTDLAQAILRAISRLIERFPHLQICLELGGDRGDQTWQFVEELGFLDRISSVRNASEVAPLAGDSTLTVVASERLRPRAVIDEAMARGRVVIRSDHPLLREQDREVQFVLDDVSVESWARTFGMLLGEPDRRGDLGLRARAHIEARNAPERVGLTWQNLLHEVNENVIYPFANTNTSGRSSS